MISYEEYYPYGRSAYRAAASGMDLSLKRYRFTGKERDEETGLDYFGVRYYASWLGRWTSGDPGGFVDGLNLYRYVRNNPVNGIDREGYSTEAAQQSPSDGDPVKKHTIEKGDNLTSIAKKHNTTVANLVQLNNLDGESMSANGYYPGTELIVGYNYRAATTWNIKERQSEKKKFYTRPKNLTKNIVQSSKDLREDTEVSMNSVVGGTKKVVKVVGTASSYTTNLILTQNNAVEKLITTTYQADMAVANASKAIGPDKFIGYYDDTYRVWSLKFYGNQYVDKAAVATQKVNYANSVAKGLEAEKALSNVATNSAKVQRFATGMKWGGVFLSSGLTIYQYSNDPDYGFKNILSADDEYNKEKALLADGVMIGVGTAFPYGTAASFVYFIAVRPFL